MGDHNDEQLEYEGARKQCESAEVRQQLEVELKRIETGEARAIPMDDVLREAEDIVARKKAERRNGQAPRLSDLTSPLLRLEDSMEYQVISVLS